MQVLQVALRVVQAHIPVCQLQHVILALLALSLTRSPVLERQRSVLVRLVPILTFQQLHAVSVLPVQSQTHLSTLGLLLARCVSRVFSPLIRPRPVRFAPLATTPTLELHRARPSAHLVRQVCLVCNQTCRVAALVRLDLLQIHCLKPVPAYVQHVRQVAIATIPQLLVRFVALVRLLQMLV